MKVYYLNATEPGRPGEHRVVQALFERDYFATDTSNISPHAVLEIDELTPDNQPVCFDLVKTLNQTDAQNLTKYYVQGGELYARDGWHPYSGD